MDAELSVSSVMWAADRHSAMQPEDLQLTGESSSHRIAAWLFYHEALDFGFSSRLGEIGRAHV